MRFIVEIIHMKGLLAVPPVQEVGWNKSSLCQGKFGAWTLPQSLRSLC